MKYKDRQEILAPLPLNAKIGFIAFCTERCLAEARRHPRSSQELAALPRLTDALATLWAKAEQDVTPDPAQVSTTLDYVSSFEQPHPSGSGVAFTADYTLTQAARVMIKGFKILQDPTAATPRYVVGALEGPVMLIGTIYQDGMAARQQEVALVDAALVRLRDHAGQPFSRTLFAGLPEWPRGTLLPSYAAGQLRDSLSDEQG